MTATLDPLQTGPLPRSKVKRWTPEQEDVLNKYDEEMTAAGKLEPSTSSTCALPILVPKKDGSWRTVFNFAPINQRIIPLVWPLEHADEVMQKLAKSKMNCAFDF